MAEHGEIVGVVETYERAAEISAAKLAAARRQVEKKRKELETVNQVRKAHGKRPLTLEEYMAIDAPVAAPAPATFVSSYTGAKVRPPLKFRESYTEFVKSFLKSLDTGSEIDVVERSKGVFFHYFPLDEFKAIVDKASVRMLSVFLYSLKNKLEDEASRFIMEGDESSKTVQFRSYVDDKIRATAMAIKIHEEEMAAAARAAALKAEADAAEAARKAEAELAAAAALAAAAGAGKNKAVDLYRQAIEEYAGAQNKAGRSGNMGARKRGMNLRAALAKYNKNGLPVNDALLTKKIKKNLTEKGLMKGGRRKTLKRRN